MTVTTRGSYPPARAAGGFVYVSGTSSRRPDNTFAGADVDAMGTTTLDIREQTAAVLDTIATVLAPHGCGLPDLVSATVYLVSMNDFGGYNEVWARYFPSSEIAPSRTTVAVHQLPHPLLLVEISAVALRPSR
jgi:2-aminomuconate deaminase